MHSSASPLIYQVCNLITHTYVCHSSFLCSGLNGVTNVRTNSERTVLQWDQMLNIDYPDCITNYSIGWNGMTYNTTDTATSVTRELLSASEFPFCMTTSVTVTPVTPMGLLDGRNSTSDVSLISPGIIKKKLSHVYYIFHSAIDFFTPTISGVYIVNVINISMVVEMNGTNVTVYNRTERNVFSGMVQVRPQKWNECYSQSL